MHTVDTVISNGIVVDRGSVLPQDVLIANGVIAGLAAPGTGRGRNIIDASGKLVLPGVIDAHNHPVFHDRMDSFTKASLSGGITTVIPYVGAAKAWAMDGTFVDAVSAFLEDAQRLSHIDFAMHCTFTANIMDEIAEAVPQLVAMGMTSFKLFTSYKKRQMMLEDDQILAVMDILAKAGCLLSVHAENDAIISYLEEKTIANGQEHPRFYPGTHPELSEAEAVFRVLSLASVSGCPIFLPHISAAESLAVISLFRQWNSLRALYVETCPHYLFLDAEETMQTKGNLARMSPPLRGGKDRAALWRGLTDGTVDMVATDATGHPVSAKEPVFDKTFSVPYGTADGDMLLRLMLDAALREKRLALPEAVRLITEAPARIFGLYPRKGVLAPGSDADVVLVDPNMEYTVPDRNPHLKTDYSLYAGRKCQGVPVMVLLRGEIAMEDGKILSRPGQGRFLPRISSGQ